MFLHSSSLPTLISAFFDALFLPLSSTVLHFLLLLLLLLLYQFSLPKDFSFDSEAGSGESCVPYSQDGDSGGGWVFYPPRNNNGRVGVKETQQRAEWSLLLTCGCQRGFTVAQKWDVLSGCAWNRKMRRCWIQRVQFFSSIFLSKWLAFTFNKITQEVNCIHFPYLYLIFTVLTPSLWLCICAL